MKVNQIVSALDKLKGINLSYELETDRIDELLSEIPRAKVCTPVIGKFSTGKSAMLNTLLGYNQKILKEDITPETSIPVEIVYTSEEDLVELMNYDGTKQSIPVSEYRNTKTDATKVKCARLKVHNSTLEDFPDVMLVDMPGFESGFSLHNRAIDDYLPQSLAYIVAFPVDDMIVRASVGNILKELGLHNMPVCVAITKCDKQKEDFDGSLAALIANLKRFIGDRDIPVCRTSALNGETDDLANYLKTIQEQAQDILARKYSVFALNAIESTIGYLKTALKGSALSESELGEKQGELNDQLAELNEEFAQKKADFRAQIQVVASEIKSDVQTALNNETTYFIKALMLNQSITENLYNLVRRTVTSSMQNRFTSKMHKYLEDLRSIMSNGALGDVYVLTNFDYDEREITVGVAGAIGNLLVKIPIVRNVVRFVLGLFSVKVPDDERREQEEQHRAYIRNKLTREVYPQVLHQIGEKVSFEINAQVEKIHHSIEQDFQRQKANLEKAMSDVLAKMDDEKRDKENFIARVQADIEQLESIKSELLN